MAVADLACIQVCLEMVKPDVPEDTTVDFSLEFVWKATSFERMNTALKLFKDYSASISGYLFHVLLGHEVSTLVSPVFGPMATRCTEPWKRDNVRKLRRVMVDIGG